MLRTTIVSLFFVVASLACQPPSTVTPPVAATPTTTTESTTTALADIDAGTVPSVALVDDSGAQVAEIGRAHV